VEDPLVYIEDMQRDDAFIRDDAAETGRYRSRFELLASLAVSGDELHTLLDELEAGFVAA
jgi:hypothetical protein